MSPAVEIILSEFVVVSVVCFVLIRYYKGLMVTPDVALSVYISWVLGLAGILLLPYDLSLAVVEELQSTSLETMWKFVYWSTFFLAWVILPIQMEYHSSGHFSFFDKLKDAFMRLLVAGLMALVAGVVYIMYMVLTSGGSFSQVLGFMMAMGNTYGVLLITVLMGNGLVALPKRLWTMGNTDNELHRLYMSAPAIEEAYQDARYELEDCEFEVNKLADQVDKAGPSSGLALSIGANVATLKESVSNFNFASRSTSRSLVTSKSAASIDYSTKSGLVALHAKLILAQLKARGCERRWRMLIEECRKNEISNSGNAAASPVGGDLESNWCIMQTELSTPTGGKSACCGGCCDNSCCISCNGNLYKFWLMHCYSTFCRVGAVVCGGASCLILWSEMMMASDLRSPIGLIMGAYDESHQNSTMVQAVSFVALAYMSLCTYWSLFRINIGWGYRLQGPQQSPPSSLIFNGEYFSRLQFSLGYNFLLCLNFKSTKLTAFNRLVENMEVVPVFGTSFTIYVPIIMVLVALVTLFDGFSKLLAFLRIESDDSGACCRRGPLTEDEQARLKTGTAIISSELRQDAVRRLELVNQLSAHSAHNKIGSVVTTTPVSKRPSGTSSVSSYVNLQDEEEEEEQDEYQFSFRGHKVLSLEEDDDSAHGRPGSSIYSSSLSANNSRSSSRHNTPAKKLQPETENPMINTGFARGAETAIGSPAPAAPLKNNNGLFGWFGASTPAKEAPQTILGTQGGRATGASQASAGKSTSGGSAAAPAKPTPSAVVARANDMFSLDDDEDDHKYRGRYADF